MSKRFIYYNSILAIIWSNLKSLLFDGVDERVTHGTISDLSNVGVASVSIWMKDGLGTASLEFVYGYYESGTSYFRLFWNQSADRFTLQYHNGVTGANVNSNTSLSRSGWHNMIIVFDGSLAVANRLKMYYDGVNVVNGYTGTPGTTTGTYTGDFTQGNDALGGTFYKGMLDELAVFDYALSSGEVTTLYNSGCPTDLMALADPKKPEHYYRNGDDDTYPTISDVGATGGNDGTMVNMESSDIVPSAPCLPYLIDTYSPEYAWSLIRIDEADSDLVLVRRSSDSAELAFNGTEISDGTLTTWTGAGDGFIKTWYNIGSAGSFDLTNSTTTQQPKLVSAGSLNTKNGQPCALYDGVDDYNYNTTQIFDTVPFSVFGVASCETSADNGRFFGNRNPASPYGGFQMQSTRSTNKNTFHIDEGATQTIYDRTATDNTNSLRLNSFTINASDEGELWVNGTSNATATTGATYNITADKTVMLGGAGAGRDNVNVSLVVAFTSDKTTDRESIDYNINNHYSIY